MARKNCENLTWSSGKKGAVGFVKSGRSYQYHALIPEGDYQQKESDSFIKRVFGGRISPFVAAFAKQDKLSQSDIDELKAIINQWESDRD
ncbi:BlaI/MecI/CopY family transcriptional regulator [Alteromonas sp. KUL49]|uniref:BlaI/MecI/CopY family transcriptional regulator n=1 Tax=Alteromonas sp. KUL49 TaxID=2480798 RepID=UPI0010FFAD0E|nr:BlaI/MecI/CopY family transcriptional regulator [Alteromonas sp. KUL49]GEA11904.1 hypothetical protein KUL49_22790 [Alteromonas sp. KUL49]